jgi:hypothetical protein
VWLRRLDWGEKRSLKQLRKYEKYLKQDLTVEDHQDPLWLHHLTLRYSKDNAFSEIPFDSAVTTSI